MLPSTDWVTEALCAQVDNELFFPEKGGSSRDAKRVCNGDRARGVQPCPVRQQCLAWALVTGQRFGVWGGLSEPERRKIRGDLARTEAA